MTVAYALEPELPAEDFRTVLVASTLGERRPIADLPRLDTMLRQADLIVTARIDGRLVGVARSLTDFSYCCYLSDLAVDAAHQRQGIGRRLIEETHRAAGPQTRLLLVAAPAAQDYYARVGLSQVASCWEIPRQPL
jgi:GNAT superfamily N-acetyltransferase